jgi:hypothetical protein
MSRTRRGEISAKHLLKNPDESNSIMYSSPESGFGSSQSSIRLVIRGLEAPELEAHRRTLVCGETFTRETRVVSRVIAPSEWVRNVKELFKSHQKVV